MSGAGVSNGGRSYDGLMHVSDVLPTLVAAAGVEGFESNGKLLDGISQWDSIARGSGSYPRSEVLIQSDPLPIEYGGQTGDSAKAAIRVGSWKLIVGSAGCPDNWLAPYRDANGFGFDDAHNCTRAPGLLRDWHRVNLLQG